MIGNPGAEGLDEMEGAEMKGTKRKYLQVIFRLVINVLENGFNERKFRRYLVCSAL